MDINDFVPQISECDKNAHKQTRKIKIKYMTIGFSIIVYIVASLVCIIYTITDLLIKI